MALGDYICCCKCEVKLIYDGDRGQREWWKERFGKPPEIECPDCKTPASKPLTDAQIGAVAADIWGSVLIAPQSYQAFARAIEAKLKENT